MAKIWTNRDKFQLKLLEKNLHIFNWAQSIRFQRTTSTLVLVNVIEDIKRNNSRCHFNIIFTEKLIRSTAARFGRFCHDQIEFEAIRSWKA